MRNGKIHNGTEISEGGFNIGRPLQANASMTDRATITGYESLYEVDTSGRVFSLERWVEARWGKQFVPSRERKLSKHGTGYLTVRLANNGKVKTHRVHRLVATAFITNPESLPDVNHKDTNKHNNGKDNLEWCDANGNMKHAADSGLTASGERNGGAKLTATQIDEAFARCKDGELITRVAKSFGVGCHTLNKAFARTGRGKEWKSGELGRRKRAAEIRWHVSA
jgi:hypothetical protein